MAKCEWGHSLCNHFSHYPGEEHSGNWCRVVRSPMISRRMLETVMGALQSASLVDPIEKATLNISTLSSPICPIRKEGRVAGKATLNISTLSSSNMPNREARMCCFRTYYLFTNPCRDGYFGFFWHVSFCFILPRFLGRCTQVFL